MDAMQFRLQMSQIPYQEPIFRHLKIPDDQVLLTGMAMGYIDETKIENTLVRK
mgnify:CR=1 FL=1